MNGAESDAGTEREGWRNGWPRNGDCIIAATGIRCAGCGLLMGATTVDFGGIDGPLQGPEWPFAESDCPLCHLRAKVADGPEDKLTARLLALRMKGPN